MKVCFKFAVLALVILGFVAPVFFLNINAASAKEKSKISRAKISKPPISQNKISQTLILESLNSKSGISQKLWPKLSHDDLQLLQKIVSAIAAKDYDKALDYALLMKKQPEKPENLEQKPETRAEVQPETKPENRDEKQAETQKMEISMEISSGHKNNTEIRSDFYEAVTDIILWHKFSQNIDPENISFSDISRFTADNPSYPNINKLRHNVEQVAIAAKIPYQASEQYFNINPADTTQSKIYLLQSKIDFLNNLQLSELQKERARKDLQNFIVTIWVKENFSLVQENDFLEKYQNQLTEIDHISRIQRLLWDDKVTEAERIMKLVSDDYQKLFAAIIELGKFPKYIERIIFSVPRKLRSDENLTYRRILWYKAQDRMDDVIDLMLDLPKKSEFAEKWWSLRKLYGREMLKKKKYKIAYELIANHNLAPDSKNFWEAQWTGGWIALRFMDKPQIAYDNFEYLYKNAVHPMTVSRSSYWLGMASEAMGNKQKAIAWYKIAAKYPVFFYGQLAIHKHRLLDDIGAQYDIILPKDPEITGRDMIKIAQLKAAQTAYLFAVIGNKTAAGEIFEWLINNMNKEGEIAVLMKLVDEIDDRQLDVKISRLAARKNVFFIKDKFQIVKEVMNDEYAPLVHAIIKQESGFAPMAVSQVGAIGFMQLMPETAKMLSKEMGIAYNRKKLATDIKYNVRLGSYYIKKLINRFDGSEILAIASYNAGPNSTNRWISEFYDPRREKDLDRIVDWIELITYTETRNYVQRIMENLIVYKYLMSRTNYDAVK
jgi:soluble lytic murein transglycosylase